MDLPYRPEGRAFCAYGVYADGSGRGIPALFVGKREGPYFDRMPPASYVGRWHSQSLVPSATEGCLPAAAGTGASPDSDRVAPGFPPICGGPDGWRLPRRSWSGSGSPASFAPRCRTESLPGIPWATLRLAHPACLRRAGSIGMKSGQSHMMGREFESPQPHHFAPPSAGFSVAVVAVAVVFRPRDFSLALGWRFKSARSRHESLCVHQSTYPHNR